MSKWSLLRDIVKISILFQIKVNEIPVTDPIGTFIKRFLDSLERENKKNIKTLFEKIIKDLPTNIKILSIKLWGKHKTKEVKSVVFV